MGVVSNLGAKSFAHNNQNYQDLDMFSYIPAICSSSVLQRLVVGQEAICRLFYCPGDALLVAILET